MTYAKAIRRLFADLDGFAAQGSAPDGGALRRGRAHVYGELTPTGVSQVVRAARLTAADRFVDLGSGVGKVVLQVAMEVPGIRCLGIELDSERHAAAKKALRMAKAEGLVAPGQCALRHDSILDAPLGRSTVLFANSTCFPAQLLGQVAARIAALRAPVTFVTLQALSDRQAKPFGQAVPRRVATSWDRAHEMYIYHLGTSEPRR